MTWPLLALQLLCQLSCCYFYSPPGRPARHTVPCNGVIFHSFCMAASLVVHRLFCWYLALSQLVDKTGSELLDSAAYGCIVQSVIHRSRSFIGPIPWGHSGPLCHALSLSSSSSSSSWTSMRRRRATVAAVATPGE